MRSFAATLATVCFFLAGCGDGSQGPPAGSAKGPPPLTPRLGEQRFSEAAAQEPLSGVLRMAVTTSTNDTGLLEELLVPAFERQYPDVRVEVLPTGTGKALKLGEDGNVDVVFVHAREAEDAFMQAGHGIRREDVMYNTFEILGPPDDPAGIKGLEAAEALQKIAEDGHPFVSRGDDSGTHKRELKLWEASGGRPEWDQYFESGSGMGATLTQADQRQAYTLSDRGTYLKRKASTSDPIELVPLAAESDDLRNPYGIIVVNPEKNDQIRADLAHAFVDFIIAPMTQKEIQEFTVEGQQLFYPLRLPEQNADSN